MTRPPLRENAVSQALHQPRGGGSGGRRVPSTAAGAAFRREARGAQAGGGARVSGSPVPPPSLARGDPANPGLSRVTLKPPSGPAGGEPGAALPLEPPRKFARAGKRALTSSGAAGGRSSTSGSSSSMRSASAQAATAGPGLGCSPMPRRRPGPGAAAGLVPGRQANFAPRRPRRSELSVRAAPPPRPPPWSQPPRRRLATPGRPALRRKLLGSRGPAGLRLRPGPYARLRGEGALGPAPASRLPALPSRSPLRTRVSSSPRTLRGRRAGGGGAAPGTAAPFPPAPPGATTRAESVRAPRPREEEGCGGLGGEVAARSRAGMAPSPPASTPGSGLSLRTGSGVGMQRLLAETHRVKDDLEAADA